MDTLHYIKWFLWAAVMFGLLYAVQAPFRKTNRNLFKLLAWFIKLIILQDELVPITDELYLLGREDTSEITRKDVSELEKAPEGAYVIVVDHSPYEDEDIISYGADLQISGHTHAGQFFPLRMIYDMLNYHAYGDYQIGSTNVLVSSGISGWGYPFRNEAHSTYDIIELRPAE